MGISGYTVRPPEARQKPRVSAFINARFDKIEALKPDFKSTYILQPGPASLTEAVRQLHGILLSVARQP